MTKLVGLFMWKLPAKPREVTDINLSICLPELPKPRRGDRQGRNHSLSIMPSTTLSRAPRFLLTTTCAR